MAAEISGVHYNHSPRRLTISLRSPMRLAVVGAVGPTGGNSVWERYGEVGPCSYAVGDRRVEADDVAAVSEGRKSGNEAMELGVAAMVTVVMGVGNRVLYKLALVPMKEYPFFLAQLATFGYFTYPFHPHSSMSFSSHIAI